MHYTAYLAMLLLWAPTAEAQDAQAMQHPDTSVEGMWLELEYARSLLELASTDGERVREVALLEQGLRLKTMEISFLRDAHELASQSRLALESVVSRAVEGRRRAENRLDAWWRQPWLWAAVGLVLGAGVVLAIGGAR